MKNIILLSLVTLMLTGCGPEKVTSQFVVSPPVIDGDLSDWSVPMVIPGNTRVAVGVAHDGQYLYLAVRTFERAIIARMVRQGLVFWFDGKGRKREKLGIRFPIPDYLPEKVTERRGDRRLMPSPERMGRRLNALLSDNIPIEIVGAGLEPEVWLTRDNESGVRIAALFADGEYTLELQFPLYARKQFPYSVDARRGKEIAVGIMLPTPQRSDMDRGEMDGGMGGGRGGGGIPGGMNRPGGGRGGPGGQSRPGGMESMQPLEVWLKIRLADS